MKEGSWFVKCLLLVISIILLSLFIACAGNKYTGKQEGVLCMGTDDPDHCDWGGPKKIDLTSVPVADNEKNIAFGIITDTHVDALTSQYGPKYCTSGGYADWYNNSQKMHNNRTIIADLNKDCSKTGAIGVDCLGIVHLGDMVNDWKTQQVLAFRQLYEHDYPGNNGGTVYSDSCISDDNGYSLGFRISYPVIPMLGNHDVTAHFEDQAKETGGYIIQRMGGATGLLAQYPSDNPSNFIWRWGQYIFVTLGLWAGSYNWGDPNHTDTSKLNWLRDNLDKFAGGDNLGVLIFQHYGWDGFSEESRWWTDDQRDMMLDVLCRRDIGPGNNGSCNPYNVIGIFTGHNHWPQQWIKVDAGKDANGNPVQFWDFSMMTAGFNTSDGTYGFSVVQLTGDHMYIHTKAHNDGKNYNQYWPTTCYEIPPSGPAAPCP